MEDRSLIATTVHRLPSKALRHPRRQQALRRRRNSTQSCGDLLSSARLKVQAQSRREDAFTRQLSVCVQRVQAIIFVRDVQHAKRDFTTQPRKAIADKTVRLDETVAWQVRGIVAAV